MVRRQKPQGKKFRSIIYPATRPPFLCSQNSTYVSGDGSLNLCDVYFAVGHEYDKQMHEPVFCRNNNHTSSSCFDSSTGTLCWSFHRYKACQHPYKVPYTSSAHNILRYTNRLLPSSHIYSSSFYERTKRR